MEKLIINKEFLQGYETLSIGLENCDVYELDVADILDISCVATAKAVKSKEYCTQDGFIKISARAAQAVEVSVLRENTLETEWDQRLRERLELCDGAADMTSFSLKDKEGKEIEIWVPYDPLESVLHGAEIELSNCPSLEIDDDGNMLILFGASSKQPTRKDNNYDELIVGWKDAFGDYLPDILKVEMFSLDSFGDGQMNLMASFNIDDKHCIKGSADLRFMNCENLRMEMFLPNYRYSEISMSRLADGRVYVGLYGLGIDFTCSEIYEGEYYKKLDDL